MLNSHVFGWVMGFFQGLWGSDVGKIFISTFIAYSASYMVYSGYVSWFSGGYGGLLLSQIGFTAIDFLGLIPTAFVLMVNWVKSTFVFLVKALLLYVFLPLGFLFIFGWVLQFFRIQIFVHSGTVFLIGLLVWISGLNIVLSSIGKQELINWSALAICFFGVFLIAFSLPLTPADIAASPVSQTWPSPIIFIAAVFSEVISLIYLSFFLTVPYLIGISLAKTALSEKMLSRLVKIVLKQPLQMLEANSPETRKTELSPKSTWLFLKRPPVEIKPTIFEYEWNESQPAFLVASFSRTTAIYLPSETTSAEQGKLLLLNNDLICSMEIEGYKIDKKS
jgi:hypothetical protein